MHSIIRTVLVAGVLALGAASFGPFATPVHSQSKQINVNSASQAQLEALPGIGAARAKVIIKHRPYKKTEEIMSKAGIPQPVYETNKSKLTVK